jgi:hypothetical protein
MNCENDIFLIYYFLIRIPEIGSRVVQQGAIPVLEKGILRQIGHGNKAIREKSLYALCYLSQIEIVKGKIMTSKVMRGVKKEFAEGTLSARSSIIHMLMNVHKRYADEDELIKSFRDPLIDLLDKGPWTAKNLCLKAICVLYDNNEDRLYLVEKGLLKHLFAIINSKSDDLQEVPLVTILYLCVHAEIPKLLIKEGAASIAIKLLFCKDHVIKELSVIILKALSLYDEESISSIIPKEKSYLLQRDVRNPQLYGGEYGGLIQEYFQGIVENRRDQRYLRDTVSAEDLKELNMTDEELEAYENIVSISLN